MNEKELAQKLRNVGPACSKQLVAVGIDTPEKLRKLGAKKAFMMIMQRMGPMHFNAAYLYALYGAIHDCDWRDVPEDKKQEFKEFTAKLRREFH